MESVWRYPNLLKKKLKNVDGYLKPIVLNGLKWSEYTKFMEYHKGEKSIKFQLQRPFIIIPPNYDEFLSYIWKEEDKERIEWIVRRWDIYFTNISMMGAILIAEIFSILLIITDIFYLVDDMSFHLTMYNSCFCLLLIVYLFILWITAYRNREEAIHMIKLNLIGKERDNTI